MCWDSAPVFLLNNCVTKIKLNLSHIAAEIVTVLYFWHHIIWKIIFNGFNKDYILYFSMDNFTAFIEGAYLKHFK